MKFAILTEHYGSLHIGLSVIVAVVAAVLIVVFMLNRKK
jgi:hypothetical protein